MAGSNNIAITGLPGDGKTALLALFAWKLYYLKGRKVITNTPFQFPHEFLQAPVLPDEGTLPMAWDRLLGDPDNLARRAALCLDELHNWLDSRESMSRSNIVLTEFFTQLRKRGLDAMYTTQDWSMVDRRIRKLTTSLFHCLGCKNGIVIVHRYMQPWYYPDQEPEEIAFNVRPIFSKYDTFFRIKRPTKMIPRSKR